jgi:HK97 family phage portal protein
VSVVGRFIPRRGAATQAIDWGLESHPLLSFFGARSQAGKTVSVESALGLAAVYSCIAVRTDTVAALSLLTYQRDGKGSRREAVSDPTYKLLRLRPNPEMTAATCWGLVETHMSAWGEFFLGKTFVGNRVAELWPIRPDRVEVERKDGVKLYWIRDGYGVRSKVPYTSNEIIHGIRFTLDGLRGLSPIGLAREAFGAGLALDEYLNKFWSEGAILSGVLSTDKEMNDDTARRLERRIRQRLNQGTRRAWRMPVLEEGLQYQPIALPLKDAQFVELQKWTLETAARVIRVPLSMVNAATSDSSLKYSTVEGENLQYLTHHIAPGLIRIEQALAADQHLFPTMERYPEFLVDTLLRADAKVRAEVFSIATGRRPWMRGSEVRPAYNLPEDDTIDELAPAPSAGAPTDGTAP